MSDEREETVRFFVMRASNREYFYYDENDDDIPSPCDGAFRAKFTCMGWVGGKDGSEREGWFVEMENRATSLMEFMDNLGERIIILPRVTFDSHDSGPKDHHTIVIYDAYVE